MDERVLEVIKEVQSFIADRDDAWSLPAESAAFVHGTVLACGAKRCVEIGTSYGHSGLWIGAAVAANGGTLLTIDTEQRKSEIAAEYFRKAGLDGVITCRTGAAASILVELPGPIDWALSDADKENCRTYVDLLYPKLPVGGVILTDNATSHDEVREQFLPWIRGDDRFVSSLIDIGNGIEFSIKVK
jgi:predicted O-methyltransferase YrrM